MGASREAAGARRRGRTVALVYETVRRPWRILMTMAGSLWGTKTKWIFGRNKGNREGLSGRVQSLDEIDWTCLLGTNCWRWRVWLVLTRFWHSLLALQEKWKLHGSTLKFFSHKTKHYGIKISKQFMVVYCVKYQEIWFQVWIFGGMNKYFRFKYEQMYNLPLFLT